jgi:hypothetical protein
MPPLYHCQQNGPAAESAWTHWDTVPAFGTGSGFGANPGADLAALAAHPDGRMRVVKVAGPADRASTPGFGVLDSVQGGPGAAWSPWAALPGEDLAGFQPLNLALALAAHTDGRMHVVVAAGDYDHPQLMHCEQNAAGAGEGWTDWQYLSAGGQEARVVALACHPDGRMHAVMAGTDNQLWHNEQTQEQPGPQGLWSGWYYLSGLGQKAKLVTLACHPDGRMHAVMVGLDNQVWHNEQTEFRVSAPWTGWRYLSGLGTKATALALACHPNGRMHAVMAGMDNQVWHNEQNGSTLNATWTGWRELSGHGTKAIMVALAPHPDGRMHAVMAGTDNQLWHNYQTTPNTGDPWKGWQELSRPGDEATGILALAVDAYQRMHALMGDKTINIGPPVPAGP